MSEDYPEVDIERGPVVYAHPLIRKVMEQVMELQKEWSGIRKDDIENKRIKEIEQVINMLRKTTAFVDKETAISVFRYFCAARLFAKYVYAMYERNWDPKFEKTDTNDFTQLDNLEISQELDGLTELSKKILESLNLHNSGKETEGDEKDGKRAALTSPGNIPFMLVYSDPKRLVYFRRNVELINHKTTKSVPIADKFERMKLHELPLFVTDNGRHVPGYLKNQSLQDVIPDKDMRKKLFENKWVTQLHVAINGASGEQVQYEFDFADFKLTMDATKTIEPEKLRDLAGVSRSPDWTRKNERDFSQEDIIISFFSNVIFSGTVRHDRCNKWENGVNCDRCVEKLQDFENWNDKLIRSVIDAAVAQGEKSSEPPNTKRTNAQAMNPPGTNLQGANAQGETSAESPDSQGNIMYLGFCFKTIIDAGYADERVVQGSTNILLMALTRGFVQLAKNNETPCIFMGIEVNNFLKENRKQNRIYEKETELFPPGLMRKRKHYNHPHFIGATPKGITVRTKLPFRFVVVTLLSIAAILIYAFLLGRRQIGPNANWEEYWSGLFGLTTSLIAVALLVTKVIYRSWELTDMFHQRRHSKCFSELKTVLEGGYKTALEVCSLLQNPEEVFSKWRSCAFADVSNGEFEIDADVYVNDLLRIGERQKRSRSNRPQNLTGFIFGVDYYGNPIVADMLGRIREVIFPEPICEKCETEETFDSFERFCDHFDVTCTTNQKVLGGARSKMDLSRWIFPWLTATSASDRSLWFPTFKKKRFSQAGYIHIGADHTLKPKYLFGLPTANLSVGSIRQDASRHRRHVSRDAYEMV